MAVSSSLFPQPHLKGKYMMASYSSSQHFRSQGPITLLNSNEDLKSFHTNGLYPPIFTVLKMKLSHF